MKFSVCTYNGRHVDPKVPIFADTEHNTGLRLDLGTQEPEKPSLFIERRPCGWAVVLTGKLSDDAVGYIYFHDDGRSWVVRENHTYPPLELSENVPAGFLQ